MMCHFFLIKKLQNKFTQTIFTTRVLHCPPPPQCLIWYHISFLPSFISCLIYLFVTIHTYDWSLILILLSYRNKRRDQVQRNAIKVRSMAASLLCSNRILVLHNNSLTLRVENPLYPRSFLSQAKRNPRRGKFCVVALTESSRVK